MGKPEPVSLPLVREFVARYGGGTLPSYRAFLDALQKMAMAHRPTNTHGARMLANGACALMYRRNLCRPVDVDRGDYRICVATADVLPPLPEAPPAPPPIAPPVPLPSGQVFLTDAQKAAARLNYEAGVDSYEGLARSYGVSVSTIKRAVKQPKPPAEVVEMRERYAEGSVSTAALGRDFGISQAAANAIVRGDSHQAAGGPIAPPRFPLPVVPGSPPCDDCKRPVALPVVRNGKNRCLRCHGVYLEKKLRDTVGERRA